MKERARRVTIPVEARVQIKHEQSCRCLVCEERFNERDLYIHHIRPVAHHRKGEGEYANRRENLCALCGECHEWADHMAFTEGTYLNELIEMTPSIEYRLTGD